LAVTRRYPSAVCAAFTPLPRPRVQRDIQEILASGANAFVASFNARTFLEVRPRQLERVRCSVPGTSIAISPASSTAARQGVDDSDAALVAQGWNPVPYHAGLDDETRRRNQDLFSRDRAPIVVATVAFGMGINKSNVRFVVHYNLPENLETYPETATGGRPARRLPAALQPRRHGHHQPFIDEAPSRTRPLGSAAPWCACRAAIAGGSCCWSISAREDGTGLRLLRQRVSRR
jgi:superfamily II DNA helicase RecQ